MSAYALLALGAGITLDGEFLWATWILLGGFALKTWIVDLKRRLD
jgi:hypothetical protein